MTPDQCILVCMCTPRLYLVRSTKRILPTKLISAFHMLPALAHVQQSNLVNKNNLLTSTVHIKQILLNEWLQLGKTPLFDKLVRFWVLRQCLVSMANASPSPNYPALYEIGMTVAKQTLVPCNVLLKGLIVLLPSTDLILN